MDRKVMIMHAVAVACIVAFFLVFLFKFRLFTNGKKQSNIIQYILNKYVLYLSTIFQTSPQLGALIFSNKL